MLLSQLLPVERIRVPLAAADKSGVIAELVEVLAADGCISQPSEVLDAILKREADRSTGIGYGLAIPHVKSNACSECVMAAGRPAAPLEYQAVDKRPVTFVVMLVSPPNQTGTHIQILAKLSSLMNNPAFRDAVAATTTADELHDVVVRFESASPKNGLT